MEEFGTGEYEAVTMDRICASHNISKGLMYHYYSNKDELFLLCVEDTFCKLKDYVEEHAQRPDGENTLEVIRDFFMLREYFIELNPQCRRIFETAIFHPPLHLEEEIDRLHEPISRFNQSYLRDVVKHMPLRQGIEPDSAIRLLEGIEFLVRSSGRRGLKFQNMDAAIAYLDELLNMALFGILCQTPDSTAKDAENN